MEHVHGRAIVLVEGLDKTGKSTLCDWLAGELAASGPVRRVHFGVPDPGQDLFALYSEALGSAAVFGGSTVIDRLHWSEEAYGTVYRKAPGLSGLEMIGLDRALMAVGGSVILRTRPVDAVLEALDDMDYPSKSRDGLARLERVFGARRARYEVPCIELPFPSMPDEGLVESLAARRTGALA